MRGPESQVLDETLSGTLSRARGLLLLHMSVDWDSPMTDAHLGADVLMGEVVSVLGHAVEVAADIESTEGADAVPSKKNILPSRPSAKDTAILDAQGVLKEVIGQLSNLFSVQVSDRSILEAGAKSEAQASMQKALEDLKRVGAVLDYALETPADENQ